VRSRLILLAVAVLGGGLTATPAGAEEVWHHELRVSLDPPRRVLAVTDKITLPGSARRPLYFLLDAELSPRLESAGGTLQRLEQPPRAELFDLGEGLLDLGAAVPLALYRLDLPAASGDFVLQYGAQRSSGEPAGSLLDPRGVLLSGASFWYPWLGDHRLHFRLEVSLPAGWKAVSQGARETHRAEPDGNRAVWRSRTPQEEIFLVAGPFTEYDKRAEALQAMAFLREPDEALAARYLDATGDYVRMYSALLGPYPYSKLALVENFHQTGYGMPSFTLLGSRVIRLPFILHSSYPHEILHNWWGNGVYVDYDHGNWSEGLTAYLADHLMKEQQGQGALYRRAALQRYADYVSQAKDFPLTEFTARHDEATQAIGYDKALMLFHMLRRRLGDQTFIAGLRRFYRRNLFHVVGYGELRQAFESVSGTDLRHFFDQWVDRTGAPQLHLGPVRVEPRAGGYRLTAALKQVQNDPRYALDVPVAVTLEGETDARLVDIGMTGAQQLLSLDFPRRPLRLDVDPEFDLFRRLDRMELPPALSQSFGASRSLVVLPAGAPPALRAVYRKLGQTLTGPQAELHLDSAQATLPADRAVWVLGWENRLRAAALDPLRAYGVQTDAAGLRISGPQYARAGHAFALAARQPANAGAPVVWIAVADPAAAPGLAAKLPHYHRYGYLVFTGSAPTNVAKGEWPVLHSPLTAMLDKASATMGRLPPRQPLTGRLPDDQGDTGGRGTGSAGS